MGAVKGCVNEDCVACRKKTHFKKTDDFCPKCGKPLFFVCADCHTQLPGDEEKYCIVCVAEQKDKRDKRMAIAKKVGDGALLLGTSALSLGGSLIIYGADKFIKKK
ncbi:hypothetical protein SDC9_67788 [bioreactor metagenome]|uniref:DZANK-type domain-containing protein n=1 Tax=bioreactor metagenome TaxID=1076179 RepID=A0A644Y579_9ZZZZ